MNTPSPTDLLLDRQKLKRQLGLWKILAVLGLMLALFTFSKMMPASIAKHEHFIGRYAIADIIMEDRERLDLLEEVKENTNIAALIVTINSPGGSAVGGQELYDALRSVAAVKPVVVVMQSVAASAAYLTALGADHILAREGTLTGSVGVILETAEISRLVEKIGITPITVKSGSLKAEPSFLNKASPEAIASLQGVIAEFHRYFVGLVGERRGLSAEQLNVVADGRVVSGSQALALKLIDGLGGESEALAWLAKEKNIDTTLPVESIEDKKTPADWLSEFSASTALAWVQHLWPEALGHGRGLLALWKI